MTGDDVEVVRGYLDDAATLDTQVRALALSLEPGDPVGYAVAPPLLHAHEGSLASVLGFVAAAEREVVQLRAVLEP